jgi:hypothetical protein
MGKLNISTKALQVDGNPPRIEHFTPAIINIHIDFSPPRAPNQAANPMNRVRHTASKDRFARDFTLLRHVNNISNTASTADSINY